jgi:beta-lactamase regulating signal transducer with metallopeptidase domain
MSLFALTTGQLWNVAGWTMLHYFWCGLVLALPLFVVRFMLRRSRPELRYAVSLGSFALLAILPFGIAWIVWPEAPTTMPVVTVEPASVDDAFGERASVGVANPESTSRPTAVSVSRPSEVTPSAAARQIVELRTIGRIVRHAPWIWLCGAPLTFILIATGLIGAERLRRESTLLTEGEIVGQLRRLKRSLAISRHVAVGCCERIASPILLGIFRPMILLPMSAVSGWSPDQIEMALLHELAHVRRWDNLVNLVQRVVESILFFQPAIWLVSHWVRCEREHCCDAIVVSRTSRAVEYAELLASLALERPIWGWAHKPHAVAASLAEHHLLTRVRQILNPEREPMRISGRALGGALAGLLLLLVFLGWCGMSDSNAADEPKPTAKLLPIPDAKGNLPKPSQLQVRGTVVDEAGNPVADVTVRARSYDPNKTAEAVTGKDGLFVLNLEEERMEVLTLHASTADRKLQAAHQFLENHGPEATSIVKLVLAPARQVSVKVVDAKGSAIPDASVELLAYFRTLEIGTTDQNGVATFLIPRDVPIDWVAGLKGGVGFDYFENFQSRPFRDVPPLPETVTLKLDGARSVDVRVVENSRKPLSGIPVGPLSFRMKGKKSPFNVPSSQMTFQRTGETGVATLDWLPTNVDGGITMCARSWDRHLAEFPRIGEAEKELTINLTTTVAASGKVTFPDGKPAPGILLQAESGGASNYGRHYVRTDADGSYSVKINPNQAYMIAVLDEDWAGETISDVTIQAGEFLKGLDIELQKGTLIHGKAIFDKDTHPPTGEVTLIQYTPIEVAAERNPNEQSRLKSARGRIVRWATRDANGEYRIRVGPGSYEMSGPERNIGRMHQLNVTNEPEIIRDFPSKY